MSRLPIERFTAYGQDLAPQYDLTISGRDTSKATELFDAIRPLVASVTFEDDEEMSSLLEITVINQPETPLGQPTNWRAVVDSKAFTEGNDIDLLMGYRGERVFMDRLQIVKWLPNFGPGGPTDFTIKGFDGRHAMTRGNQKKSAGKKRKTFYQKKADSDIVADIAKKYGYGSDTDVPVVKKKAVRTEKGVHHEFPTRVQGSDHSDWQFLQKLAKINNFDLWVSYDNSKKQHVVYFKQRQHAGQAEYKFTYNGEDGSLISAAPDFSIQDQPTDVEVHYYDRKTRKVKQTIIQETHESEKVKLSDGRIGPGQLQAKETIIQGAAVRFTAGGRTIEAFGKKPFRNEKEAKAFVENWLRERERDLIVMQGTVIGIPTLRSRQIHQLAGLGARLDGFYRFTNVKHKMAAGEPYVCEFTAHKILETDFARRASTATVSEA
jgi:phage protein D